ncbi:hypothetical protein J4528_06475 [Neisseria subflava]|uniref:hypothetical protein n=1 Tax=Neisseria TaxID=482 RepID=UPI0008A8489B|nr:MULTISPECIES: hypothetical protein [Neisseria]MCL9791954.1 hypothetical protein [Neisseria subflava]OHP48772.1 hypothetical protein HMPREF2661_07305 [Neisseria sp. HMSC061B04]
MTTQKISCLLFRTHKEPSEVDLEANIFLDELHLNLWDFDNKCTYLDLGLLIDITSLEKLDKKELFISIPGKYEFADFLDLGKELSSNLDMVTAIFNEPTISTTKNQTFTAITRNKKNIIIIPFLIHKTFKFSYREDILCTEIIIDLKKIAQIVKDNNLNSIESKHAYIRFRVKTASKTNFIKSFTPEDEGVLSSTIKSKILDVRINESRWLPSFLMDNCHLEFVKFKKIHFFLIINQEYELGDHSKNYNTSRSLTQEDIWQKYLFLNKGDNIVQNSLGYHWKMDNGDKSTESFSLLGRFSRIETSTRKIFMFLLFILLIGLVSSSLVNLIIIFFTEHGSIIRNPNFYILSFSIILICLLVFKKKLLNLYTIIFNHSLDEI